jgi:hypothetical protein
VTECARHDVVHEGCLSFELRLDDVAWLPRLVEPRLQRAGKLQDRESALAGDPPDSILLFTGAPMGLRLLELLRILCRKVIRYAEVLRRVVKFPSIVGERRSVGLEPTFSPPTRVCARYILAIKEQLTSSLKPAIRAGTPTAASCNSHGTGDQTNGEACTMGHLRRSS